MNSKNIDKPIESVDEDLFGFKKVAELLAQSIAEPPNISSISLGLEGQWGSGKSSILKLLENELSASEQARKPEEIGIVNVSFSPWLITNRSALIITFFAQLNEALDIASKRIPKKGYFKRSAISKALNSAKSKANQFSGLVSSAAAVASAFDPSIFAAGAAASAKAIEKYTTNHEASIEKLKSELTELLLEIAKIDPTFRVLVTIDDLDRLEPEETLEVIRLVKAVADFPATFYLLSYDRNVVAEAIQQSVKIDNGESYLEKIIQFAFKVPPLEPFVLRKWLQRELAKDYKNEIDFSALRSHVVFDNWCGRLLKTPRDIRRLLLSIQLIWPKLKGKIDLLDLIWLQMIKEKASSKDKDLYSWVCNYLQSLDAVAIGGNVNGKKESQEELEKILITMGWRVYEHDEENAYDFDMHNLDQILVGITHSYLGERNQNNQLWIYKYNDDAINKARENKRLSSPWHWRIYLALELPSHALSDTEWNALIEASKDSAAKLKNLIQVLLEDSVGNRTDIGDQIVERTVYGIRSKAIPQPTHWLLAIAELSENFEKLSKSDGLFGFSSHYEYSSRNLAQEVISQTKGAERKALLKAIFVDFGATCFVSRVIRNQISYEKKEGYEREEYLYLTPAEIKRIKKSLAKTYSNLSDEEFLKLYDPWDILYTWRAISGSYEPPQSFFKNIIKTDKSLVATLEALRKISSSTHGNKPHLRTDTLKNFVAPEEIKKRLEKISASDAELAEHACEILGVWDDSH